MGNMHYNNEIHVYNDIQFMAILHSLGGSQRRCDMRHELLTQRVLFLSMQKVHAESAFRDTCHTSSGGLHGYANCTQLCSTVHPCIATHVTTM